jgi:hypothetical protein
MRKFLRWGQQKPGFPVAQLEKNIAENEQGSPTIASRYRYFSKGFDSFRLEDWGPPEKKRAEPVIYLFRSDRWQTFSSAGEHRPVPQLSIYGTHQRFYLPYMEVALANAVPLDNMLLDNFRLTSRATLIQQLPWLDFLSIADGGLVVERQDLEKRKDVPTRFFEITTPPWKETGLGLFRGRLWLDADHGYMPSRLECYDLEPDRIDKKHSYLLSRVVEWSDPLDLPEGVTVPQTCKIRIYEPYPEVDERRGKDFLRKAYEIRVWEIRVSRIQINQPLDDSLFEIKAPMGTHVADHAQGYTYVIGSAGEELQKTAIALRDSSGNPIVPRSGLSRTMLLVYAIALTACVAGAYWAYRKRYRRSS